MNLDSKLLFFFSALGAFNGMLLSVYFGFVIKNRKRSNYFLSFLFLVLSIRVIKSVFYYFNPKLSEIYIQVGLSACVLIGPFLYVYIKSQMDDMKTRFWVLHIVPVLVGIIALGIVFPYWSYYELWSGKIIHLIYFQWFIYIVFTTYELRAVLKRLITRNDKNNSLEIWLLSVYFGILSIWLAYATSSFTSYIVGAISFSFFLYLLILIWFLKLNKDRLFFETKGKYENRKVKKDTIESIMGSLSTIEKKKLYQNPNIKLSDVASELNVVPHILSQVLNEHLGKSFSVFINEYRVEKAKKMLVENELYTIEGIGLDSGFKSKSAFFKSFKTITGTTPAKYRDSHRAI